MIEQPCLPDNYLALLLKPTVEQMRFNRIQAICGDFAYAVRAPDGEIEISNTF